MTDADYVARWLARCKVTERGCWEWQGFCQTFRNIKPGQRGYPMAGYRGMQVRVTRQMLAIHQRPLQAGEICMHKCDNPPCINPAHLKIGTYTENMRDCSKKGRADKQWKTHCLRGHAYAEHGALHGKDKWRKCTICTRARFRIRYGGWSEAEAFNTPALSPSKRGEYAWAKRRAKQQEKAS